MRAAVIRFPGSNCDQDAFHALQDDVGIEAEFVWHEATSLDRFDAAFLPGGFSYGDYLRCGAMAARAPVMAAIHEMAKAGMPILGACNGFQILCEAGLLPGALLQNEKEKFVCKSVTLEAVNRTSVFTCGVNGLLRIPIAHGEGRYVCDDATLAELIQNDRIAFRYVGDNPNGSIANIAGVLNAQGNVLGMMPHPERATKARLGSVDGLQILKAFQQQFVPQVQPLATP
jgi:phosphoribosylformylglycinamidine synthase